MIDALLLISIVFFFLLLFFLGFSLFYFSPVSFSTTDNFFIRLLLYLGSGLGTLVFLIILFDVGGIPLDYRIFFAISLLCPLHFVLFHWNNFISSLQGLFSFSSYSKKEVLCFGAIFVAALVLFYTFLVGAFAYPYLEDDDPWEHAVAVKYIADEKTYYQPSGEAISHYLEPYPPTYDALLALVYQINGSIFLTLKVFNVLLIALGILFFFLFARELFGLEVATVAALVLVVLPSWMSHFIWSHTLALVLFFPALMLALRGFTDQRYILPAVILIAAEMVTHPFVAILFGAFYIILVLWHVGFTFASLQKKTFTTMNAFTSSFLIGFFGVALSFLYWGQQLLRHGLENILYSHTGGFSGVASSGLETAADLYINPAYTLSDFLVAPLVTKIDQPTGFGVLVFVFVLFSVLYLLWNWKNYFSAEKYHLVVLVWFVLTFVGLLGGHLPFSILTHRFWAYVSIPMALLVGIFVVLLFEKIQNRTVAIVVGSLLFVGVFGIPSFDAFNAYTSWYPKYVVETSSWPPGVAWSSVQELEGYMWMHDNLAGSRVLSLCKEERFLIGFDVETHFPNDEMNAFRKTIATKTVEELVEKSAGYDALSLEYTCVKKGYLTEEELNTFANALASEFSVLFMNDEVVVYALN
ncbi:glycosyltransferase family 39 protein [Candidatus Woesearchaeota archaeon]|nr:glycosyltransferase family 39 protein [Candidatus Woesearchaeota archaeon]